MVKLYKDVKNLCLEFAGIRVEKIYDVDNDTLLNNYSYKCDVCGMWKYQNWTYIRDFYFYRKNENITDDGNEIHVNYIKYRFWRLHLCSDCKKKKVVSSSKNISVKTFELKFA